MQTQHSGSCNTHCAMSLDMNFEGESQRMSRLDRMAEQLLSRQVSPTSFDANERYVRSLNLIVGLYGQMESERLQEIRCRIDQCREQMARIEGEQIEEFTRCIKEEHREMYEKLVQSGQFTTNRAGIPFLNLRQVIQFIREQLEISQRSKQNALPLDYGSTLRSTPHNNNNNN